MWIICLMRFPFTLHDDKYTDLQQTVPKLISIVVGRLGLPAMASLAFINCFAEDGEAAVEDNLEKDLEDALEEALFSGGCLSSGVRLS